MGVFRLTIYGIIAGVFLYAIYYDIVYLPRIGHSWWIYKLVMLTMINLVLQAIYYVICFACAFMDALREKTDYGPHKNIQQHRVIGEIQNFIVFLISYDLFDFWALYAVESTLVIPKWAEGLIPPFMNHITHTAPLPFLLVDTLLTCHRAPPRQIGSVVVLALVPCYFIIVVGVRYFHGYWLYPFLEYLSVAGLILMFLISFVFLWLLYIIGDTMNIMLWGQAYFIILQLFYIQ
ncbi:Androgen-induced protein [Dirofilaria immitis]|nr:Androgen-induced protein [Dirofilaria immitis]